MKTFLNKILPLGLLGTYTMLYLICVGVAFSTKNTGLIVMVVSCTTFVAGTAFGRHLGRIELRSMQALERVQQEG